MKKKIERYLTCINNIAKSGIGDDLFEAFFADEEPVKKKPAAVAVEPTTAAPEPPKPAVKKTNRKKSSVKKTPAKKATSAPPKAESELSEKEKEKEKEKPQFQHTPALLELAQQNDKGDATEKIESDSTEATVGEKVISFGCEHFSLRLN